MGARCATAVVGALGLVSLVVAGCAGGIGGTEPAPARLDSALLTTGDVGADYVEEVRGGIGFDTVGALCPEGRDLVGDALDVLSSDSPSATVLFASPPDRTGGDPGDRLVQQHVVEGDPQALAAALAALERGYSACYGSDWKEYGETYTAEPLELPAVGDERFGVTRRHFATMPTAYIRAGELLTIVTLEEVPGADRPESSTIDEHARLVEAAARTLAEAGAEP